MVDNTFLGLQPYTEDDAYRFKGRTEESQELFRLIVRNDFTVCYAESGEGKTSLLNAGVFPLLRENMYFPIAITFTSDDYKVMPDSFDAIIDRCIKDSITEYNEKNKGVNIEYKLCSTDFQGLDSQAELQQELSKHSWWKLRNHKPQAMGLTFTPVFVFDQFEEVFNIPGSIVWTKKFFDWLENVSSDSCPDEIVKKVRDIIGDKAAFPTIKEGKSFKAIFSLRKEFIGELDYWGMQKCFIPGLKDNRYCLKALTYEGAKKVMTQYKSFDEGKVEKVLRHFVGQYSKEPEHTIADNLPVIPALLLSIVCDSWEKDIETFISLNTDDIEQTLCKILEHFYNKSIDLVVKDLFNHDAAYSSEQYRYDLDTAVFSLVDSNGKRVRTKTTSSSLAQIDFDNKYKKILCDYRIIKVTKVEGEDYIELIHDILCPIVNNRLKHREQLAKEKEAKRVEEENRRIKLQNDKLNRIRSLFLSEKSVSCNKNRYLAQMLALEALPLDIEHPDKPLVPQAESALRKSFRIPYCPMIGHKDIVTRVMITSGGTQVFSSSRDGRICIWDAFSGALLKEYNCGESGITTISEKKDGDKIGVVYANGVVQIYSFDKSKIIEKISLDGVPPTAVAISPDGTKIAIGLKGGNVKLYTMKQEKTYLLPNIETIDALIFSPDGEKIIAMGEGRLDYYSAKTGKWGSLYEDFRYAISCVSYSIDGMYLFCGTKYGKIIIIENCTGKRKKKNIIECENEDCRISVVSASCNSKKIAYSIDGKLTILECDPQYGWSQQKAKEDGKEFQMGKTNLLNDDFDSKIMSVAWSPDDRYVVWGNTGGQVCLYDIKPATQQRVLLPDAKAKSFMKVIAFSKDGKRINCLSDHNTFRIIDIESGELLHRENHFNDNTIGKEFFCSNGKYRAICNKSRHMLELYEANNEDYNLKAKYDFTFKDEVTSISVNSDFSLIALATEDGNVSCINTNSKVSIYNLAGCKLQYNTVLFSPVGRYVATTAPQGKVIIWDEKSGTQEYEIPEEKGYVHSLAFSPDGERLAIGTESGMIRIWNIATKEQVDLLERNNGGVKVKRLSFTPNGEQLVASYDDGALILWTCPSLKSLMDGIRQKLRLRKFTPEERKKYYLD